MKEIKIEDILLAQNGNEEKINEILDSFKPIIKKNNHLFFLKGGDNDDLLQEGYIGLLKAIKYFNPSKKVNFRTFATLCIRSQIISSIKLYNSNKHLVLNSSISENIFIENIDSFVFETFHTYKFNPENIFFEKEQINSLIDFSNNYLSKFEQKIFMYLCMKYTYREITDILNESDKKIDNTIQRIRRKLKNSEFY
ncbi:MAG: sigma-70 family RNA polymerase sigma factor [Cetobacterium sp.]